mmetsp:Transcript_43482/g.102115  ORF Transcript_43482/g.102115 Transcript_43482/m.102115 type:complete len:342 (-) Transcript_43482:357-1382(-)
MGVSHVIVVSGVLLLGVVVVSGQVETLIDRLGETFCAIYLAVFYVFFALTATAYARVTLTSPGRPQDLLTGVAASPYMEAGKDAQKKLMRQCNRCKCNKPERCHHCSDCNSCTLKMDHHCPWVNNCVGFRNYKFFYLLLLYGTVTELLTIALLIYSLLEKDGKFKPWDYASMATIALVGLFAIGTVGLAVFHTSLLLVNQTTIEQLQSVSSEKYSIGYKNNVRQALGGNPLLWLVPCVWGVPDPEFDGVNWDNPQTRPAFASDIEAGPTATDSPHPPTAAGMDAIEIEMSGPSGSMPYPDAGALGGVRAQAQLSVAAPPIAGANIADQNSIEQRMAQGYAA